MIWQGPEGTLQGPNVFTLVAESWGDQELQGMAREHARAAAIYHELWKYFSISSVGILVLAYTW